MNILENIKNIFKKSKKQKSYIHIGTPIIFILAGNLHQYRDFILRNELKSDDFVYLRKYDQLLGCRNFKIIRYGTWYNLNSKLLDFIKIEENKLMAYEYNDKR